MHDPEEGATSTDAEALALRLMELPEAGREAALGQLTAGNPELEGEIRALLASFARAEAFFQRLDPLRVALLGGQAGEGGGGRDGSGPGDPADPTLDPAGGLADGTEAHLEDIGPWRVEELLGRGGMGTVYLARRRESDYDHRVAVKVLHPGLARGPFRERFLVERRILASLSHPGIAPFIEGGWLPDGRPYLAMEYVEGEDLIAWADARRLGLRARVELYLQVCRAVAYAHRHLVIHRDLKPSNTRVTPEGVVKLLDFGVAKVLHPEGAPGLDPEITDLHPFTSRALTPAYASPEQLRGEPVGVASDLYSMGLLLWRLLAGELPVDRSGPTQGKGETDPSTLLPGERLQTEGRLEEAAAARGLSPDRLRRGLRGDLTAILHTCLRPEPEARYGSATELEAELVRYLEGRAVHARSGSRVYRARRFIARNTWGLAAGLVAALALGGGMAGLWAHSHRLEMERDRATQEAERARAATAFVVDLFEGAGEGTALDTVRAGTLLERGEARLRDRTAGHPLLQAELLLALADANARLQRVGEDMRLRDERLSLLEPHLGPESLDFARELMIHAGYRASHYQWIPSRDAGLRARAIIDAALARGDAVDPELRASTLSQLALALRHTGDTDGSVAAGMEALEIRRALERPAHGGGNPDADDADEALLQAMADLASGLRGAERLDEAEEILQYLVAEGERRGSELSRRTRARFHNDLGALLRLRERYDEAEPHYRTALGLVRATAGPGSESVETLVHNLHYLMARSGRLEAAEALADSFRITLLETYPADHWRVGRAHMRMGWGWVNVEGPCEPGLAHLEVGSGIYAEALGPDHAWTVSAMADVARCLFRVGREGEGAEILAWAIPILGEDERYGAARFRALAELMSDYLEGSARSDEAREFRRRWMPAEGG